MHRYFTYKAVWHWNANSSPDYPGDIAHIARSLSFGNRTPLWLPSHYGLPHGREWIGVVLVEEGGGHQSSQFTHPLLREKIKKCVHTIGCKGRYTHVAHATKHNVKMYILYSSYGALKGSYLNRTKPYVFAWEWNISIQNQSLIWAHNYRPFTSLILTLNNKSSILTRIRANRYSASGSVVSVSHDFGTHGVGSGLIILQWSTEVYIIRTWICI